jgi:hypothetical protein
LGCSEIAGKRFAVRTHQDTFAFMSNRPDRLARARAHLATAIVATSILLVAAADGWSQADGPSASRDVEAPAQQTMPQPDASAAPAPAPENPGLFNELGKMFEKFPTLKSPQQTMEDLNAGARDAAKSASDGLSWLAKPSSMVSGRIICPVSANGAADCKLGADRLCQSKGFKEGKSLNVDAAETCSAKVLIPGRTRKPDDCRTDNFVTRALCQ